MAGAFNIFKGGWYKGREIAVDKMEWYRLNSQRVLEELGSNRQGLSAQEAQRRLKEYGKNQIRKKKQKSWFRVFLEQFQDLLVWILIAAAVVSAMTDNGESAVVIGAVLLLNAVLGTVEHQKAQKSLNGLQALSAPEAKVIRDGKRERVAAADVVPGDILVLETGDLAAADGRLLEVVDLRVNESSLTGEAQEVEKEIRMLKDEEVPLASRSNMVFSGSLVTGGRGVAVVTSTGMETELGQIAGLMNKTEEKRTPLEHSLDQFSGRLALGILVVCVLVFWMDIYRGESLLNAVMFAVALAVAAIPEALGSIVTIVQAMGTQKMARENAIIKDLKAVESLGCVSVICTDKTGTLTQNRMEVEEIYCPAKEGEELLWRAAVLANNATDQGGEPTETALYRGAVQAGVLTQLIRQRFPRKGEKPFDSGRKRMSVWCLDRETGKEVIFAKGGLEAILACCKRMNGNGGSKELSGEEIRKLKEKSQQWGREGMRVLAFACRELEDGRLWDDREEDGADKGKERRGGQRDWEKGLTFLGMAALTDPLRPESRSAVAAAKGAGIRPVMITGDHPVTAASIARKAGILEPGGMVVTGPELEKMEEKELLEKLDRIDVYARVSPEHKLRIVEAWQKKGRITAMTGDGVNDGPALKTADIGIAMGKGGTQVSREAAAMILADDNFSTIIQAVANGRNVYRNIKNAIGFLLSGNMAGIFCVLYATLAGLPMPFLPVHLLFINLVTDSLPALAIGMEPPEEGLLRQPPRRGKEGILNGNFLKDLLVQGVLIALCTMAAYSMGMSGGISGTGALFENGGNFMRTPERVATTMAFTTLTLARLFHGFNCRSAHSILRIGLGSNLYSIMAFELGVLFLIGVLFLPGLQRLFMAADLKLVEIIAVLVCALFPTILIQAQKLLREGRN